MQFDHIIKLSPEELYEKALEFKKINDIDNYYIYMTMSANYNYKLAEDELENDYKLKLHVKQNHSNTIKFYEVTKNYSYSANYFGYMYDSGQDITQDYSKAIELYEVAIAKGNAYAMSNLGIIYGNGEGVIQDHNKAKELYERAILKGNSTAMTNLAYMYNHGNGVTQNYNKAVELYQMAVEKGCGISMNNLAYMYSRGNGVTQDYNKSIEIYQMAIEKGRITSINNLVIIYKKTKTNKQDIINYFLKINQQDRLKDIYKYDDYDIQLIVDYSKLTKKITEFEKKINELETHIMASPEGELYFEAKEHWSKCLPTKN